MLLWTVQVFAGRAHVFRQTALARSAVNITRVGVAVVDSMCTSLTPAQTLVLHMLVLRHESEV